MIGNTIYYGKAAILGFLLGNMAFLLVGLFSGVGFFSDQLRAFLPCIAVGVLGSLAVASIVHWRMTLLDR